MAAPAKNPLSTVPLPNIQHLSSDPQAILPFLLQAGLHILGAVAILTVGFWVSGRADAGVRRALKHSHRVDDMLRGFFASLARYFILTITVLAVLSQFGIQTTSLVAVLGAASLAIGLALQGTLSNLAAGVMLLLFRPFRAGQSVTVGGNTGTVHALSLFWTEIVTDANVQIIIPNASVWGQPIKNMSTYTAPAATAELRIPVPEGWRLRDAVDKITPIVAAMPRIRKQPPPSVLLDRSPTDNAPQIVISFTPDGDVAGLVKDDILKAVDDATQPDGAVVPAKPEVALT